MDKKQNIACFSAHSKNNKTCKNNSCRYWHDLEDNNTNCILNIIDEKDSYTLQDVGDLFNITRMRVCQIEKTILSKLKKSLSLSV